MTVFIRTDSGKLISKRIDFTVPRDVQPGTLTLTVADAATAQQNSSVASYNASTLKETIDLLNRVRKDDRLYLQLSKSGNSLVIGTSEMPNLPPSVSASMGTGNFTGGTKSVSQNVILDVEVERSEFATSGNQTMTITVVR